MKILTFDYKPLEAGLPPKQAETGIYYNVHKKRYEIWSFKSKKRLPYVIAGIRKDQITSDSDFNQLVNILEKHIKSG